MSDPKRIQRRRARGWRMPAGAVYVGRPGPWGNPFRVFGANEFLYCDASHRRTILTPWVVFDHDQDWRRTPATPAVVVGHYRRWLTGEFDAARVVRPCPPGYLDAIREHLRGRDLACWCPVVDAAGNRVPCHADVLLELANR